MSLYPEDAITNMSARIREKNCSSKHTRSDQIVLEQPKHPIQPYTEAEIQHFEILSP